MINIFKKNLHEGLNYPAVKFKLNSNQIVSYLIQFNFLAISVISVTALAMQVQQEVIITARLDFIVTL